MAEGFAKQGKGLHGLTESVAHVVKHMGTKSDIADLRREMATKLQLSGIQTQMNSIERQLRQTKTKIRLSDLRRNYFGASRA